MKERVDAMEKKRGGTVLSRGSKLMYGNVLHMLTRPDKRQFRLRAPGIT